MSSDPTDPTFEEVFRAEYLAEARHARRQRLRFYVPLALGILIGAAVGHVSLGAMTAHVAERVQQ